MACNNSNSSKSFSGLYRFFSTFFKNSEQVLEGLHFQQLQIFTRLYSINEFRLKTLSTLKKLYSALFKIFIFEKYKQAQT